MVAFRSMLSVAKNFLNHAKRSFKLHSDIVRSTAPFCSAKGEVDVPPPPKRPPSSYMVFCKENRPNVLKEYPDLRGAELIKILAAKWATLTPSLRKPYEETARQSTIIYGKLHKEFYENLTDDQRHALLKLKTVKQEIKKIQKLKKALKDSGKPRAPTNAYSTFVQMKAKEIGEIRSGPNFIKQAAEDWKALSEEEKRVFYEKAKEDRQRFEIELTKWKEKLREEGHEDLLKFYEEGKYRHRMIASGNSGSMKASVTKKMSSMKTIKN